MAKNHFLALWMIQKCIFVTFEVDSSAFMMEADELADGQQTTNNSSVGGVTNQDKSKKLMQNVWQIQLINVDKVHSINLFAS